MTPPNVIVIGFDFGTSFSKVVVRNLDTDQSEAVSFLLPGGGTTVLLPAVMSIYDGQLYPVFGQASGGHVPYLKMLARSFFRDGPNDEMTPACVRELAQRWDRREVVVGLLAWYFAHVLAGVEHALPTTEVIRSQPWGGANAQTDVVVQLCIPVGDLRDQALVGAMQEALELAYVLRGSVDPCMVADPQNVADWFAACDEARRVVAAFVLKPGCDMATFCFTYPEVSAGIQTVLQSSRARDGVYITMDVGAGTVDLNVFHQLRAHGRFPLNYLACRVSPLGAQRLTSRKGINPYESLHLTGWQDGAFPMPSLDNAAMAQKLRFELRELVKSGMGQQPNRGDTQGQRTWDHPSVYLWGGRFGNSAVSGNPAHYVGRLGHSQCGCHAPPCGRRSPNARCTGFWTHCNWLRIIVPPRKLGRDSVAIRTPRLSSRAPTLAPHASSSARRSGIQLDAGRDRLTIRCETAKCSSHITVYLARNRFCHLTIRSVSGIRLLHRGTGLAVLSASLELPQLVLRPRVTYLQ